MRVYIICYAILFSALAYGQKVKIVPCGNGGPIEKRVASCETQKKTKNGSLWNLVTRTPTGEEVWQDVAADTIWGVSLNQKFGQIAATKACGRNLPQHGYTLTTKKWKLPRNEDFETAKNHGMDEILQNPKPAGAFFWSETLSQDCIEKLIHSNECASWAFYPREQTLKSTTGINTEGSVRCIAHL